MKLNSSSTSIQTHGSHHSKRQVSRCNRQLVKENQEKILFDLTDFQSSESIPPSPLQPSDHNKTRSFFQSKSISSDPKLPPLNHRYHVAQHVSTELLLKRRALKENSNLPSRSNLKKPSADLEKLSQEFISHPGAEDFQRYNKNAQRIREMQLMNHTQTNIFGRLNSVMNNENCLPRKLQILDTHTDKEILAAGQLSSKGYVKMFAAGLGSTSYEGVKKVNLNSNNLTNEDLKIIVKEMPKSVTAVEMKQNKFSKHGAKSINELILKPNSCLLELNLERNHLKDQGLAILLDSLHSNRTLRVLNVSHNKIQDSCMEAFGKILRKNTVLQELYMHYNQITFRGGAQIFKGLHKNTVLKVLDLSFNKLGANSECTAALCSVLSRPHPELIHLDLAHNEFNEDDSLKIATSLAFNKIIYGFHFEGNDSYRINHRGFLMPPKKEEKVNVTQQDEINVEEQDQRLFEAQLQNLEHNLPKVKNEIMRIDSVNFVKDATENCWICQGWVECVFQWKNTKSGHIDQEPLFLHLEFEDYRPSLMQEAPGGFVLYRMCPPNQTIRYFYSNPVLNVQVYAKDQKTTQTQHHSQLRNFGVPLLYANGTVVTSQPMHVVNMIHTGEPTQIIDKTRHYLPKVFCKPREPERIVEIDPELAKKRVWSLDTSIFKDYEADTEAHLEQCLDFDLDASKVAKHIYGSHELQALKAVVQQYYPFIISCYKYQASQSLEYDFPRIVMPVIQGFFQQSKALQQIKQVDWEISLISTLVMRDVEHQFFKERCLVRHQFLELIIRLAKESYLRNGAVKTLSQAVNKMLSPNGHLSFINDFGSAQQWRDERYWIQIVDLTIRFKMPLLKALFNYTSHLSNKSFTKEKFVSLSDFKQLFSNVSLFPDLVTEQELYFCFLQSIMMQVDELNSPRHMQMEFIEFIEALARMAEKLAPNSPAYKEKYLNGKQRRTLPLYVKFEGLLYILYYRLRKFEVDPNIVDKSVLSSHEAKKLGLFYEESESEDEDELSSEPAYVMARLLHEDEGRISFKDNQSSGSKSRKSSVHKQENSITGWAKIRQMARRPTHQNQLSLLKLALVENEMDEKAEFEESTPLNKMRIENRKLTRSKFDTIKFDGPQYKYDLLE